MGHFEAMTEEAKRAVLEKLDSLKPGEVHMDAGCYGGRISACIVQKDPNGRTNAILLDRESITAIHKQLGELIATAENDVSRN